MTSKFGRRMFANPLTAITGLLAIAILLGGCHDAAHKKQRALERGTMFYDAHRYDEAIVELKNAVQLDAKFAPALVLLGRSYTAKFWGPAAVKELERAFETQPDSVPAMEALVQTYVTFESWKEALKYGEMLRVADPQNPWGLYGVGSALTGQGQPEKSAEVLAPLMASGTRRAEFAKAYGDALAALKRPDEAEKFYREAIGLNPKYGDALLALGSLLISRDKKDAGRQSIIDARDAEPENPRPRLAVASLATAAGKTDEAIKELEPVSPRARTMAFTMTLADLYVRAGKADLAVPLLTPIAQFFPNAPEPHFLLGRALLYGGQAARALGEFQNAQRLSGDSVPLRFHIALARERSGQAAEALTELRAIATAMNAVPDYHLAMTRVLLALGRYDEATKSAESVRALAPQSGASYGLLGDIAATRGDMKRAWEMYAKSTEVDPRRPEGFLALGNISARNQRPEDALREYDAALERDPKHVPSILAKAQILMSLKRADTALKFVEARVADDPRNPRLSTMRGHLYMAKKDLARARETYGRVIAIDESWAAARLGLAAVAMAEKKDTEATVHLGRVLKDDPGNVNAVLNLASIHVRQAHYDQVISVLEAAVKANPRAEALPLTLGEVYVQAGRFDDALKTLSPIVAANPKQIRARLGMGLAYLGKVNTGEAIKQFEAVKQIDPKLATAHHYLGRARMVAGDTEGARRELAEALKLDPSARQVEVELAVLTKQASGAINELKSAVAEDPSNVALRYSLATAYTTAKRQKEAEAEYQAILKVAPTFAPANFALGMQRLNEGKGSEGVEFLNAALRTNPNDAKTNAVLAGYYQQIGKREQAITHLEAIERATPDAAKVRLLLVKLYAESGRVDDAIAKARQAAADDPRSAKPHAMLGTLYLSRGDSARAIESFQKAVSVNPKDLDAYLGLGNAYEQRSDIDRAEAAYRKLMALAPQSPIPYNNLAALYANSGRDLNEALNWAQRAQALAPKAAPVLETLGIVYYKRGEYAKAAPVLSEAAATMKNSAMLQYHLGMTLYKLGRNDEAARSLEKSLELDGKLADAPQVRKILAGLGRSAPATRSLQ